MITAEIEESVSHKADESCGRALAGIRRLRGRTGADVARESGLSRRTITKVEQGDDSVAFRSYLKVADVSLARPGYSGCSMTLALTPD